VAICKASSVVSGVSGALGGQVFVHTRSGTVIRQRPVKKLCATPARLYQRATMSNALHQWRSLTDLQRLAWRTAAQSYLSTNRLGVRRLLTPVQLYTHVVITSLLAGAAVPTAPPFPLVESPFSYIEKYFDSGYYLIWNWARFGQPINGRISVSGARSMRSYSSLLTPHGHNYTHIGNYACTGPQLNLYSDWIARLGPLGSLEHYSVVVTYVHTSGGIAPPYYIDWRHVS